MTITEPGNLPPRAMAARMSRKLTQYGMLGVLLLLCAFFSLVTLQSQYPTGRRAAKDVAKQLARTVQPPAEAWIVTRATAEDLRFTDALEKILTDQQRQVVRIAAGEPAQLRRSIENLLIERPLPAVFLTLHGYAPIAHGVLGDINETKEVPILEARPYRWPTFLLAGNLLNVANQIAVIAILAIGMTMVIITGGIDLSVGSLIALSAVVAAWSIGRVGAETASAGAMLAGALAAILACGISGAFSGLVITRFRVPPFIATLGMMQVASCLAYIISRGKPVYKLPEKFGALGRGADPGLGIPYAVILMVFLYASAHVLMSRTTLGRYIYAVGGNAEAARLAGVRVRAVLMFVYVTCGMLAGLGGVVMASQLKSGAPTYGLMYELYVIAAVVVGGTSLSGGQGRILGTLVGAFIIAVIQNGMNLTNVESYTQKVVLGLVILGAVLLDKLKRGAN
jgi:ribose transport system permease protein